MADVSVFICGRPRRDCSTTGCKRRASTECTYPVKRNGAPAKCGRGLCSVCAVVTGENVHCPPHARLKGRIR